MLSKKTLATCIAALAMLAPVGSALAAFPCTVSVRVSGSHTCNGTIVDNDTVVTAAHCVGGALSQLTVLAGTNNLLQGGTLRTVAAAQRHPNYSTSATYPNDIAVLRLSSPLTFGTNIQACTMGSAAVPAGTSCNVVGFSAGVLKVVPLQAQSTSNFGTLPLKDPNNAAILPSGFSAASVYCNGSTTKLDGVMSYYTSTPSQPAVATAIWYYLSWIQSNM